MKKIIFAIVSMALVLSMVSCSKKLAVKTVSTNLSANGTANCYIVPAAGYYFFDATIIGNGQKGIIPGAKFHTDKAGIRPASCTMRPGRFSGAGTYGAPRPLLM